MLYKVSLTLTFNGMLDIEADNEHFANEEAARLEISLLDEINNWGLSELRDLRLTSQIQPAVEHN